MSNDLQHRIALLLAAESERAAETAEERLEQMTLERDEARAERDNLERYLGIWEVPYCACGRQLTECDGSRAGCLVSTGKTKARTSDGLL